MMRDLLNITELYIAVLAIGYIILAVGLYQLHRPKPHSKSRKKLSDKRDR